MTEATRVAAITGHLAVDGKGDASAEDLVDDLFHVFTQASEFPQLRCWLTAPQRAGRAASGR